MSDNGFRFGDWQINPDSNSLCQGSTTATVEPKAMDVLRYLCRHPGAVIPPEELLQACWGNAELGDNPIHKAITQLRRALGDSASEPRYIETVRKRGYRAIAPVMAAEDLQEGSWQQGSPFRGLESFQESHASIFFGRMQATAQLRELVLNQATAGSAMALVLGPSGSGKTSLVRAGLLPRLMASRTGSGEPVALACTLYMDCADLADGNLFQALAAVLMDAEIDGKLLFAGENAEELGRWLESSDAQAIAGRLAEASGRIKIGLFVDRLEAIFRAPGVTDEIRARFIAVLEYLASSRAVLVMLACRNDFYPEVIALPALMALKSRGGHFDLNPPDGAEIAQMVRMPAKAAGLKFEVDAATGAALDDVLCDAARGSPDTLPLLQYCLNELYRQRSEDGTLRFEVFRQLGGIEGAIAVRAEQVVTGLSTAQANALPHVLSQIVDVAEEQATVTARRIPWTALPGTSARELAQALVEARLFVSELAGNIPSLGMAHEALLRRWPRVVSWIDQHRHALQIRTRISQDADRWANAGRLRDLLLPPGSQMNQAKGLMELEGFVLSRLESEYIHASLQKVRRSEKIKAGVMILFCLLAIVATLLGIKARQSQTEAETSRIEAEGLMGYMLGDFIEKLRPLGRLDLLNDVSTKALSYLSDNGSTSENEAEILQRAKALQVIAEINISRSNPSEAEKALLLGRSILKKLDEQKSRKKEVIKQSGTNSFWLGQMNLNRHDWDTAERYFSEYRAYSDRLASVDPNSVDSWVEQSYAHNNIGTVAINRGNVELAINEFSIAISMMQKAVSRQPNNKKLLAELAHMMSWLASAKVRHGKLMEAMELYHEEQRTLRSLLENDKDNLVLARRLAVAVWRQGDLEIALGDQASGLRSLSYAEQLHKNFIDKDPSNLQWRLRLYLLNLKRLEASADNIAPTKTTPELSEIKKNLEELLETDPNRVEIHQLIAFVEREYAKIDFRNGDRVGTSKHIDTALSTLKAMHNKDPSSQMLSIDISRILLDKAEFQRSSGLVSDMRSACQDAVKILAPLSKNTLDYRILEVLARAYTCLSDHDTAKPYIGSLENMSYKDVNYIRSISSQPARKGNL